MTAKIRAAALPFTLVLAFEACSPEQDTSLPSESAPPTTNAIAQVSPAEAANANAVPRPATPGEASSPVPQLTEAGFAGYIVGNKITFSGPAPAVEEPRISDTCRMYKDPNLPDLWIMTDGGDVIRRITILGSSTLKTSKGIGLGASEANVRAAYPGISKEPSEYVMPPGGNLYTAPADKPGLRFDLDEKGKVVEISGGTPPHLQYSEGCA